MKGSGPGRTLQSMHFLNPTGRGRHGTASLVRKASVNDGYEVGRPLGPCLIEGRAHCLWGSLLEQEGHPVEKQGLALF